jgi:cytoskeletal protein CcmA (bactofilin family)
LQINWKRLKPRGSSHGDWSGFLDKAVRFEGTIEVPGTFRLEADVRGTIISSGSLTLGEGARVDGQIQGNHVVVGGRFDGAIFAKGRVEILPKGIVTGEIHAPCVVIEAGGIFDGVCHMTAANASAKPVTIPIRSVQQG